MNSQLLPSALVTGFRNRLKPHAHSGVTMSPEEVCEALRELRTIEEAVLDLEEDNSILDRRIKTLVPPRETATGNPVQGGKVLRMPARPRIVFPRPGGDAA